MKFQPFEQFRQPAYQLSDSAGWLVWRNEHGRIEREYYLYGGRLAGSSPLIEDALIAFLNGRLADIRSTMMNDWIDLVVQVDQEDLQVAHDLVAAWEPTAPDAPRGGKALRAP